MQAARRCSAEITHRRAGPADTSLLPLACAINRIGPAPWRNSTTSAWRTTSSGPATRDRATIALVPFAMMSGRSASVSPSMSAQNADQCSPWVMSRSFVEDSARSVVIPRPRPLKPRRASGRRSGHAVLQLPGPAIRGHRNNAFRRRPGRLQVDNRPQQPRADPPVA